MLLTVAALCIPAATASAQAAADKATAPSEDDRPAVFKAVIDQLEAEARELEVWKTKPKVAPYFARPHKQVARLSIDDTAMILARLRKPFTGNEYRDSYIRWHLMHVIKQASDEQLSTAAPALIDLLKQLPGPLQGTVRDEVRRVPPENYSKWYQLYHSARATTGYPPFQDTIYGPKAIPLMDPAARPQAQANLKLAAQIKWRTIVDENARAYNNRIRRLNVIVRQYRGEVIYCLVRTGEPQVLALIAKAIETHVRKKHHIAFDLLAYVYQAAFDGALAQYDEPIREAFSDHLERLARQNQRYVAYGNIKRNFADYAFHLIHMMDNPAKLVSPEMRSGARGS